jgi:hypothetical protein
MPLMIFRSSLVIAAVGFLSACSLYSSAGRKALASGAFTLAGQHIAENFEACSQAFENETFFFATDKASVFTEESPLHIRVELSDDSKFSCSYRFSDQAQMENRVSDAIDATESLKSGGR